VREEALEYFLCDLKRDVTVLVNVFSQEHRCPRAKGGYVKVSRNLLSQSQQRCQFTCASIGNSRKVEFHQFWFTSAQQIKNKDRQ